MNLLNNPFYILGVSTRHSSQDILIAAEEKSLLIDDNDCVNAKKILTNPRQRIAAELAWLPGVSPARTLDVSEKIVSAPRELIQNIWSFEPLSRCNIISTLIEKNLKNIPQEHVKKWIIVLAEAYERIEIDSIIDFLNEDRSIAKIAKIQNIDDVENELDNRKQFLVSVSMQLLRSVKNPDKVLADILDTMLIKNDDIPLLLEYMVDDYRLEVQKYLDKYGEKLNKYIENIKKQADIVKGSSSQLSIMIDQFVEVLTQWDQLAQPIQLISKNRGIDEDMSCFMADRIRDTALYLANTYGLHEEAKIISERMSIVFQELPQFSETVNDDLSSLEEIIANKNKAIEEDEEWKRSITLDIEFGKIFKDRLIITPQVFVFNKTKYLLSAITRLRWGVYTHSTNGIRDHTSYGVWVGTRDKIVNIECSLKLELDSTSKERYGTVINKLWRAVGVRLMFETLSRLSSGETVTYGRNGLRVDKDGIYLIRNKFFGANESIHCRWEEFTYSGYQGSLHITSRKEKKICGQLSYRDDDNTHILESILDFLFKDGNHIKLRQGAFK